MVKPFLRHNVGGMIFTKPTKGNFFSVESWLEAKAPSNCLIYDDPYNLQILGITIVDAIKVDGVYYRGKAEVPKETKISLLRFTEHKIVAASEMDLDDFPGLIFYDKDAKKHAAKNIGTTVAVW